MNGEKATLCVSLDQRKTIFVEHILPESQTPDVIRAKERAEQYLYELLRAYS
jgi:hypothetical protein